MAVVDAMTEQGLSIAVQHSMSKGVTVVKIGGAALTHKATFETINIEIFDNVVSQIHQVWAEQQGRLIIVHGAGSFGHFQAKKYSVQRGYKGWEEHKRPSRTIEQTSDSIDAHAHSVEQQNSYKTAMKDLELLAMGFSLTRQSVTKLCTLLVDALIDIGIPAVSVPVLPIIVTENCEPAPTDTNLHCVNGLLARGMLPVLHGDAVLDMKQYCSILSGDTILRELSVDKSYNVDSVVFMTNVLGIYDRPPQSKPVTDNQATKQKTSNASLIGESCTLSEDDSNVASDRQTRTSMFEKTTPANDSPQLLRHVCLSRTGGSRVTTWNEYIDQQNDHNTHTSDSKMYHNITNIVLGASGDTDVTGGMNTKIAEARVIADAGVPVIIVEAGTSHSLQALQDGISIVRGIEKTDEPVSEWRGTVVSSSE